MLELLDATHTIDAEDGERHLLNHVTIAVPPRHFMAVVGPSGCGKSTLMKLVAGILEESEGGVYWQGRNLAEDGDLEPWQLGYVPQFSIAYDFLTVEESIESSIHLRIEVDDEQTDAIMDYVLKETGLESIRDRRVKVLSGGQKRRLGLAMELVSDPTVLLCDEVTSGLDAKSEEEIVRLLHHLAQSNENRVVMNITHSLAHMELYDSVLVLTEGYVAYHGPSRALMHYFSVDRVEDIYPTLSKRTAVEWAASWTKRRSAYYQKFGVQTNVIKLEALDSEGRLVASNAAQAVTEDEAAHPDHEANRANDDEYYPLKLDKTRWFRRAKKPELRTDQLKEEKLRPDDEEDPADAPETPGFFAQLRTVLARRWKIFFRDKTQIFLHLAMMIGFPILVVIFALDGIEPMRSLTERKEANMLIEQKQQMALFAQQLDTGSLISGLVMFQVVLLTLMGANNSAREIASERLIFEKEKLAGLRVSSYLASKIVFLSVLVLAQAVWMVLFVSLIVPSLPGDLMWRLLLLTLATGAMTSVCLGISALMKTPEQATLLSIYLVGFQLPLSGAVLALPDRIESFVQPFIAAFWSWSGSLRTIEGNSFYSAIQTVSKTELIPPSVAAYVLLLHVLVGLILAWIGARRGQWD